MCCKCCAEAAALSEGYNSVERVLQLKYNYDSRPGLFKKNSKLLYRTYKEERLATESLKIKKRR
jgi:hypothetical protein